MATLTNPCFETNRLSTSTCFVIQSRATSATQATTTATRINQQNNPGKGKRKGAFQIPAPRFAAWIPASFHIYSHGLTHFAACHPGKHCWDRRCDLIDWFGSIALIDLIAVVFLFYFIFPVEIGAGQSSALNPARRHLFSFGVTFYYFSFLQLFYYTSNHINRYGSSFVTPESNGHRLYSQPFGAIV